jgi:hypothetical protein
LAEGKGRANLPGMPTFPMPTQTTSDPISSRAWQIDCGVAKRIAFAERYQLQFRAEAFNIFNRAQLGAPQSDISAGPDEFGRIIQPVNKSPIGAGAPRQIQLALRLEF